MLTAYKADLLLKWQEYIELRVANHGADRAVVDTLAIAHLGLARPVVKKICADGHKLSFEKVAQLAAQLTKSLREIKRLRKVDTVRNLEVEGD